MAAIDVVFLRDTDHGGDQRQPSTIAGKLADFVSGATNSVHIAMYDFRLSTELAGPVVAALKDTAARGVEVRIAYDHGGKPDPQPENAAVDNVLAFSAVGGDPAPVGTHQWLQDTFAATAVALGPINPGHQLMHDKYIVRDAGDRNAVVWTGSTNFTDDAWTFQDNNIITVASPALATAYQTDFDELWSTGAIRDTGRGDEGSTTVDTTTLGWRFAPGGGTDIDDALTAMVTSAAGDIAIASMVLTSHNVLGALAAALQRGLGLSGVYDAGQMDPIVAEWQKNPHTQPTAQLFKTVAAHLVGKHSEPYSPTSKHNFMHDKVLVTGETTATGSFNISHNATRNAENSLVVTDPDLAARYRAQIADLVAAYTP